jgi:hypothetical protein
LLCCKVMSYLVSAFADSNEFWSIFFFFCLSFVMLQDLLPVPGATAGYRGTISGAVSCT